MGASCVALEVLRDAHPCRLEAISSESYATTLRLMARQKEETASDTAPPQSRGKRAQSSFPKYPLAEAVKVAQVIEDTNAGQPLPPVETALAMDLSPRNSQFEQLTSASIKYGLTSGSSRADEISITDLGQSVVSPESPEAKAQALLSAALAPETFRDLYAFFRGKKLPEEQFLLNTIVRQFDIPREHAAVCARVFLANMELVGLVKSRGTDRYLSTQARPVLSPDTNDEDPEDEIADDVSPDDRADTDTPPLQVGAPPPAASARKKRPNRIFIGHGRNHKPLEQLTKTLDNLSIPYAVAADEATVGRPISKKVRDTMDECGAAILIFSADVEYFDKDGNSVWRPSENVSHELGAASVMYDDRIILFKESSVSLASNYSGIGYIPFEKDALDAKVNDLLRELVAFKILKLSLSDDE